MKNKILKWVLLNSKKKLHTQLSHVLGMQIIF